MIAFNISVQNTTANSSVFDTDINSPRHQSVHPKLINLYLYEYLVSGLGSVFNLLALLFVMLTPDLRIEKSNIFITSLILANILITLKLGLLQLPIKQLHAYDNNCLYATVLTIFTISASCFSRSLIAIDRYNYICHPLHYQSKTTNLYVGTMLIMQWATSTALAATAYFGFSDRKLNERHSYPICMPFSTSLSGMIILAFVVTMSSLIITYVYCIIFYWAYIQIRLMRQETIMRATQRSSTITVQEYFKSAWRIRRITRATDLLVPIENKDSAGTFTLILDKTAMSEREKSKRIATYLTNAFRSFTNKIQKWAGAKQTSVTRSTSVDDSCPSPRVSEFTNAVVIAPPAKLSVPDEAADAAKNMEVEEEDGVAAAAHAEVVETIPVSALEYDLIAGMSDEVLRDKWYEHELKRYTGSVLSSFFFATPDRRMSQGSMMMIEMLNRREIKALSVVLITFGAHLLCWLPYLVYSMSSLYWNIYLTASQETLVLLVGSSCCVFDPIVYCLLNQPFRHSTVSYCRNCWNSLEM